MTKVQTTNRPGHTDCPFAMYSQEEIEKAMKDQTTRAKTILQVCSVVVSMIVLVCGLVFSAGLASNKIDNNRADLDKLIELTTTKFGQVDAKLELLAVSMGEIRGMANDLNDIKRLIFSVYPGYAKANATVTGTTGDE